MMNTRPIFLITLIAAAITSFAMAAEAPPLRIMQTKNGTRFGICANKPARPAPTLFVIAGPITSVAADKSRFFMATGDALSKEGWIQVVLDPVCEGYDLKQGQPSSLAGWAVHARKGEDFVGPYLRNCSDVLDHLIAEGFTDAERVAVQGVSRGGFCALHFAAREPRIKVVVGVSPVTNPLALTEFAGVTVPQVADFSLDRVLEKLAGRTVWVSIGNSDDRVSTDDCVAFTRRLIATTRKLQPNLNLIPVHLHVGMSAGHRSPNDAYSSAADFLLRALP